MYEAEAAPPTRSYMDDPNIEWKEGRPDFSVVNRKYMAERRMRHPEGSLEKTVENLVKTWEMESSHKPNPKDWGTVDPEKFQISANGSRKFSLKENTELGNYLMLMWDSPFLDRENETMDSTFTNFKTAFPNGFAWELLEVLSGPPKVTFTWRHWTDWTGPYKGISPTGDQIELTGMAKAVVDDDLKILDLELYYDPNPMMAKLMGLERGAKRTGTCPFHG